ncbi:hypothetical protein HanRHA438_Chr17g0802501 [Helianthus annuus]|nr:hypothetical protein HanRHA438_Chr17g0802501 [Helianthus annuus]
MIPSTFVSTYIFLPFLSQAYTFHGIYLFFLTLICLSTPISFNYPNKVLKGYGLRSRTKADASDHHPYQILPSTRIYLRPCWHARTQLTVPIGLAMRRLTLCMKMIVFVTTRDAVTIVVTTNSDAAQHRTLKIFSSRQRTRKQPRLPHIAMRPSTTSY